MTTIIQNQDVLWVGALAAAPVALMIALMCRGVGRPATRHALWVLALLTFIVPGVLMATGWTQAIGRAILGVPSALAWAFPPERAGVDAAIEANETFEGTLVDGEESSLIDGGRGGASPAAPMVDVAADQPRAVPPPAVRSAGPMVLADRSEQLGAPSRMADRTAESLPAWPTLTDATAGRRERATTDEIRRGLELAAMNRLVERASASEPQRSSSAMPLTGGSFGGRFARSVEGVVAAPSPALTPRVATTLDRKPTAIEARKVIVDLGSGMADRVLAALGQATGLPLVVADRAGDPIRAGDSSSEGTERLGEAVGSASRADTRGSVKPAITDPIWNALASAGGAMRVWAAAIGRAADSIWQIPAPPAVLWVGGVVVIIALGSARTLAGHAAVRKMQPVDRTDRRLVQDLSEKLGLRHAPRAFIVKSRISPMVCGGLNPKIILPEALWRTLDLDARRAVLTHELAHLRRRDQWVRLMELAIGVLYWWHPVLWAVRRRIREEADLCCDAWVTTLFPGLRRSYAEALLRTRCYLSIPGATAPVAGLGMASARSRRFSRRLTMVMTGQTRPKTSPWGLALALAVGTAALVVVPSIAHATLKKPLCPPGETAVASSGGGGAFAGTLTTTGSGARAGQVSVATGGRATASTSPSAQGGAFYSAGGANAVPAPSAQGGSCCTGEAGAVATTAASDPTRFYGQATAAASPVADAQSRFYGTVSAAGSGGAYGGGQGGADAFNPVRYAGAMQAYTTTPAPSAGGLEDRVGALEARIEALDASIQRLLMKMESGASNPFFTTPEPTAALRSFYSSPQFEVMADDEAEQSWTEYSLPSDKAEALYEFMRRDDVPIYVSLGDGSISLQGTPSQQRVFAQFLAMVHPDGASEWLGGDVEVADQYRAAVEMEAARTAAVYERDARAMLERELAADASNRGAAMRAREMELVARRDAMHSHRAALEAELVARQQQAREMGAQRRGEVRRQMQNMDRQAQEMERRAEEVERRMQQLYERAGSARNDAQREQLEAQAEALEAEAEALREAADELRSESDDVTAELEDAMAEMEAELADAQAEIADAMAEMEAELAEAAEGEHAENCACSDDCTGEGCEDDCDENCHCRGGAAAAPAAPTQPAAPAAPARAARPARAAQPATPAAPATPRPIRD